MAAWDSDPTIILLPLSSITNPLREPFTASNVETSQPLEVNE